MKNKIVSHLLQGLAVFLPGFVLFVNLAGLFQDTSAVYSNYLYAIIFAVLFLAAIVWVCSVRIIFAIRYSHPQKTG